MAKKESRKKRCGAKTRAGGKCQRWALAGSERCRIHGGKSLSGVDSATAKHLRYSKAPKRLHEGIEAALADEKLLELRQEAGLLQERANDLLSRVDSGESGQLWRATKKTWEKYLKALRRDDEDDVAEFRQYLNQLITMGDDDYSAWEDVYKVLDQKRRISESERKRMHDMELMIAANQIGTLIMAVGEMFRANAMKHVRDADERRLLLTDTQADIGRFVSGGSG